MLRIIDYQPSHDHSEEDDVVTFKTVRHTTWFASWNDIEEIFTVGLVIKGDIYVPAIVCKDPEGVRLPFPG